MTQIVSKTEIDYTFRDRIIAVTGGLGSIGSAIVLNLLQYRPREIRIIENRETEIFYSLNIYNDIVNFIYGDVRERSAMSNFLKDVDIVFHASAMKHVIICEKNPFEAVKTNVIGTQNIIEVCKQNNISKMILISTDKAVNPTNVMGATKLLGERIVSAMHEIPNKAGTKYGIVRFGNVLFSRGSVLEIWEKQLRQAKKITVTNPEMTRFFMKIPQCVNLIFAATYFVQNGETFILKMPSIKIRDLAEAFLEVKGSSPHNFEIIGTKPGEKEHEELLSENESMLVMENRDFFLRLPLFADRTQIENWEKLGFVKSTETRFRSNDTKYLLDKERIKNELNGLDYAIESKIDED